MKMNYNEVYNKIIDNFSKLNIKYEIKKENKIICPDNSIIVETKPYIEICINKKENCIDFKYGDCQQGIIVTGWFDGSAQDFHEMFTDIVKFYYENIEKTLDNENDK